MASATRRRTPLIALSIAVPLLLIFAVTDLKYMPEYVGAILEDCPETYQSPALKQPFLVIGHRGSAGQEVENTLPAIRRAMEIDSANGVEIDLCMTADSVIVLWHDWDPDSPISEARELGLETDVMYRPLYPPEDTPQRTLVHKLTLEQLRQHYGYTLKDPEQSKRVPAVIPTLEEFLALASNYDRLRLVYFDLKIPEDQAALAPAYFARIRQALDNARPHYTVVFMTAQTKILDIIEKMYDGDNITFDVEPPAGLVLKPWEINSARTAIERGNAFASTVHPKASTWAPWTTLKRLIENDVKMRDEYNRTNPRTPIKAVIAATITEPEKMRCLIAGGVDGIVSDDPMLLRKVAREMGRVVE